MHAHPPNPSQAWLAARAGAIAVAAASSLALGGCSMFAFSPSLELLKASGTAASYMVAGVPVKAVDTVQHGDMPDGLARGVCIVFNPGVSVQEFLPAMQGALQRRQIDSRVFESDAESPQCPVWLHYMATVEWGAPPWSNVARPYVLRATLTLKTAEGRVLASSNYEPGGALEMGKWATTGAKVDAVVQALVSGSQG